MIGPASRPARALRLAGVIAVAALAVRAPTMRARFAAAVRAAGPVVPTPAHAVDWREPQRSVRPVIAPSPLAAFADHAPPTGPARLRPTLAATRAERFPPPRTLVTPPLTTAAASPPEPLQPAATPISAVVAAVPTGTPDPGAAATAAYARLALGDRRGAVRLFDDALRSNDPRAATWRIQRAALIRRWSASAYSIVRGDGPVGLAAEPVLGGGQSGGALAVTLDPLAPRPVAVTLRGSVGHDDGGRSAFAAVGVSWRPLTGVTVAAERRIAVGPAAHDDWTLRLAGGVDLTHGRLRLTAYGEGGIVGAATYAAVQARAAVSVRPGHFTLEPGVGGWASVQHDRATVDRIDVGPGVIARAGRLTAEIDYRVRVGGNAAPSSGPVLTLSATF